MRLTMTNWIIAPSEKPFIGYEGENQTAEIVIACDVLGDWTYYLKLADETRTYHYLLLTKDLIRKTLSVTVTRGMIGPAGQKFLQVEGRTSREDIPIKCSNVIRATAGRSIHVESEFPEYEPSEADQYLATISGYAETCAEAAALATEKEEEIREHLNDAWHGTFAINEDGHLILSKIQL